MLFLRRRASCADGLPVRHASEALSLQEQFRSMLEYPVAVLMKGSRGTGLERLLPSAGEEPSRGRWCNQQDVVSVVTQKH